MYNRILLFERCLTSVLHQSLPHDQYEVIIVDNNSSDDIEAAVKRLKQTSQVEVRYLREKQPGPAAARNKGIRNAGGRYLAFIDADCVAEKTWLEHIHRPLTRTPHIGGVGGRSEHAPLRHTTVNHYCRYISLNTTPRITENGIEYIITNNCCIPKTVFDTVGLFDKKYDVPGGEDLELSRRIRSSGYQLYYENKAAVYESSKERLSDLIKSFYAYGKGEENAFTSNRAEVLSYCLCAFCKTLIDIACIPFFAILFFAEGKTVKTSITFAFYDCVRKTAFKTGTIKTMVTSHAQ